MSKLRLLKVIVQPVLVEDDGEYLTEQNVEPIQVPAKEWPDYPKRLEAEIAKTQGDS